jgi:nucleolar MIF4G domain-containing protein 1
MMEEGLELAKEKRQLLELAKSFHMVTEAKRNIFVALMDSKDYIEATQRILELNVRHQQDIATVLVEVCTLEPSFNPFYPLVAGKIASLKPKFRQNIQYGIWDHLKLIDQYELRRTSNLAKFTAKLISDHAANCSLSILKYYPDISNIRAIDTTFLNIFFNHFFKKVKKEHLSKLVSKLREDNNRDVKMGLS